MMEVAALGKPIIVGQFTDNFRLPVGALRAAEAILIVDSPEALSSSVGDILAGRKATAQLGARARQVVIDNQGATTQTADALVRLLGTA